MKKIVVEERNSDYIAYLEADTGIWGRGKSKAAAIGDLMVAHRRQFDIAIEYRCEAVNVKTTLEARLQSIEARLKELESCKQTVDIDPCGDDAAYAAAMELEHGQY